MASPSSLLSILVCACCHNSFQDYPSTLACGHSVCAVHVEKHTCNFQFNSSSSVTYIPEEDNPPSQPPPLPTSPDVTLLKVHTLVRSAAHDLAPSNSDNADLHNDSDDDRPRKRRRRRSSDSSASDDDLLSHLRTQSLRQRLTRQDQPLLPSALPSTRQEILARFRKDLLSELSCEICFTLFYQPVTTPCQHTFCSKCLHRALDHSPVCPICRQNLPPFLYFQEHPTNTTLYSIILKAFPEHFQERKEAIEEEERNARLDTPIFVCQLSFPGMPTLLHFFEPRYRLMLRRCLESQRPYFGMIMPPKPGSSTNQTEYGTMLEIRTVQPLSDGRSLVEAWGSYRFRILESGTLDGYLVGRIERIDDYADELDADPPTSPEIPMPPPPSTTPPDSALSSRATSPVPSATASTSTDSLPQLDSIVNPIRRRPPPRLPAVLPSQPSNAILMERCRSFLDQLERGTAPWIVQRLSNTFGQMPPDVASFSFWVASILPIDEFEKAKLLPIRSPRLRLLLVVHWIEQLNNNWYSNFLLSPFFPLRPLVSLRRTLSLTGLVFLFLIGSILWHSPFYLASVQKVVLEWMRNSMTNCASSSQQD